MRSHNQYYFLAISLPELKLGVEPELTWDELLSLFHTNLSKEDYAQVESFLRYFDLCNMRSIWQKVPLGFIGNLDGQEIQARLLEGQGFPKYVLNYLEKWPTDEERIGHFGELLKDFYEEEVRDKSPFLEKYLKFDRDFRLITTFLRAKNRGLSFQAEVPYSDEDSLVDHLLSEEKKEEPELPEPFDELKRIFTKYAEDPKSLDHALDEFRYAWVHKEIDFDPFSINHILGVMVLFLMAHKEFSQKDPKQVQLINQIIEAINKGEV